VPPRLREKLVQPDTLLARVADLPVNEELRDHLGRMLRGTIAK
jgi:hypothetical protein